MPLTFPRLLAAAALLLSTTLAAAQTTLPVPLSLQKTYAQGTRAQNGQPGPKYWQNTADYDINVSFDPKTRLVAGTVTISYVNNSPDSLQHLWFKLYPNLYQKGAPAPAPLSPRTFTTE
ncbi:hypothetical protein [Hymenobacter cellulosilyticus]|uniref:M1 family peptidase n=1 Tax=Hymenobacter cellulosilyticus TaxID=2932248 RepID=A0A8T9Q1H5_9BACT|nr:hypothetical protein [Hymenobacter cellulosilyticus]UOQ70281.1 hypothetical protein MUN79_16160 [Hymenobacter cellulosilyticus]